MPRPGGLERLLEFKNIEEISNRELREGEEVGVCCRIASLRGLLVHISALDKRGTGTAFEPSKIAWISVGLALHVPEEKLVLLEQEPPVNDNLIGFVEAIVVDPKPDPDEPRVVRVKMVDERSEITEYFNVRRSDLFVSKE